MEELKSILWDYFGQLNEKKAGIKIKEEDRVHKPEALVRYDLSKDLGVPYVAGGLEDQPYLWMKEHSVITQFLYEWKVVETATANFNTPK